MSIQCWHSVSQNYMLSNFSSVINPSYVISFNLLIFLWIKRTELQQRMATNFNASHNLITWNEGSVWYVSIKKFPATINWTKTCLVPRLFLEMYFWSLCEVRKLTFYHMKAISCFWEWFLDRLPIWYFPFELAA